MSAGATVVTCGVEGRQCRSSDYACIVSSPGFKRIFISSSALEKHFINFCVVLRVLSQYCYITSLKILRVLSKLIFLDLFGTIKNNKGQVPTPPL